MNIQGECGTVEIGGVSMKVKDWAATAAPTGLLRADGSLCLDLLPMEYYGEAFQVVQGPLYNPESIDRDKVYATTTWGEWPPVWMNADDLVNAVIAIDENRPILKWEADKA